MVLVSPVPVFVGLVGGVPGNWRLHLLFHDAILEGGDGGCEGGEQRPLQTIVEEL